jgi:hypothetical protein
VVSQLDTERFDEKHMMFANHPCRIRHGESAVNCVREMDELNQTSFLYKHYLNFQAPAVFIENIRSLVHSGKYELL